MEGKDIDRVYDPLRKKLVPLTPEERVRQWFIGVLSSSVEVPLHKMRSEVFMTWGPEVGALYGVRRKTYRADIAVYSRGGGVAMIVECKRPEVALSQETAIQAIRYAMILGTSYLALVNGQAAVLYRREGDGFKPLAQMPSYEEITTYHDTRNVCSGSS